MTPHENIKSLKARFGSDLLILAHYYQRDEVIEHADIQGDSYALALAASRSEATHIVFCGVTFMAESARILTRPEQHVYLPDFEAGCPLADMVDPVSFEASMRALGEQTGAAFIPIVYINSSATVKAAVAGQGGITCTSSNAKNLVQKFLENGQNILFLPDKNLGINTAQALGLSSAERAVLPAGGEVREMGRDVKMVIWNGFCNVHVRFRETDVLKAKNLHPYARIIVHPECSPEVVARADYAGSTSGIIEECSKARPGDVLYIGTERNLVERLAQTRRDVKIFPLRESGCVNMNKITAEKLSATLSSLGQGSSPYEVSVAPDVAARAVNALRGMIERVEDGRK